MAEKLSSELASLRIAREEQPPKSRAWMGWVAGILVASLIAGAGMGLVGGFFPALRASQVSPIEAMRT